MEAGRESGGRWRAMPEALEVVRAVELRCEMKRDLCTGSTVVLRTTRICNDSVIVTGKVG